jgi:YidC/Oxa1 family membrane protein insertase
MWAFFVLAALAAAPLCAQDDKKNEPAPPTKTEVKAEAEPKSEAKPQTKTEPRPDATAEAAPVPEYQPQAAAEAKVSTLGSIEAGSGFKMQAQFTGWGGGVYHIDLTDYYATAEKKEPYEVLAPVKTGDAEYYHFAARAVTINGTRIDLMANVNVFRWELVEPGVYRYQINDAEGQPVLRITRRYSLGQGAAGYDLTCHQVFENLTDQPLKLVWEQYGHGDIAADEAGYMGDRRAFEAGYFDLGYDPDKVHIYTEKTAIARTSVLKDKPFYPNKSLPEKAQLVWYASSNRYFSLVTHRPAPDKEDAAPADVPALADAWKFDTVMLGDASTAPEDRGVMFTLTSNEFEVAPHAQASLDLSMFAGPRTTAVLDQQPYRAMELSKLVVYTLGCTFCTFQWLAQGLLAFLKGIEFLVRDWGIAIVILVMCVRLVLHPITRKSQINMTKMSKQMAAIQPELDKIKKKYADDPKKQQQEQAKLFREKNVSPAGMLGCLPMFLQMPIWIALYAMLYFAIELRQQPAFYGLFQAITGGKWGFLSDLSSPDRFVTFYDTPRQFNLLLFHIDYSSINILPILMGFMYFFQQQLMAPPPANEQQASQQKIMRWMMLLFPLMFYSMPSGLTLYILASSMAGMVDSYYVRKHIKAEEAAGTLLTPKKRKAGGFMARIQKMAEAKQADMQQGNPSARGGRAGRKKRRKPSR